MRTPISLATAFAAALALAVAAVPALAAAPDHETFSFSFAYTDTDMCSFPITVEGEFTNMIIDSSLAIGTGTLQLHQRDAETWTANGVNLSARGDYNIFITWLNGVPQTAKHVGLLNDITAPDGNHLFFRTGEAVYQVVWDPNLGHYVDGPLIARHGVRDNFDATEICAAFS
jgi:hypothetical protein